MSRPNCEGVGSREPNPLMTDTYKLTYSASDDADDKYLARLQAEAALVRCALYPLASGNYLLTHTGWGLSRELPSLRAVQALLRQMSWGAR